MKLWIEAKLLLPLVAQKPPLVFCLTFNLPKVSFRLIICERNARFGEQTVTPPPNVSLIFPPNCVLSCALIYLLP
jgi:hypothetical protein